MTGENVSESEFVQEERHDFASCSRSEGSFRPEVLLEEADDVKQSRSGRRKRKREE